MAIFDNTGKAELEKWNISISEEEKKINDIYSHLGQQYFTLYGANPAPELSEYVKTIQTAQNNIDTYKKMIDDYNSVKRCVNCGAEVPDNALFCMFCATPVSNDTDVTAGLDKSTVVCPTCGETMSKDMNFCTKCGNKISEIKTTSDAITVPVDEPEPAPEIVEIVDIPEIADPVFESDMKAPLVQKCFNCGGDLDDDSNFCTQCGTRVKFD